MTNPPRVRSRLARVDVSSGKPRAVRLAQADDSRNRDRVYDCEVPLGSFPPRPSPDYRDPGVARRPQREVRYGDPRPPEPPPPPPPPPPGVFLNEALWAIQECSGPQLKNSVAVFVLAGLFSSSISVEHANELAIAANMPRLSGQLNCSPLACQALTPTPVGFVNGFEQICSGGYWYSEPVLGLEDGVVVNTQYL